MREAVYAVPGDICATARPDQLPVDKIAVLRVDCDCYEPVEAALQGLYDMVQPGGWVIVDDYTNPMCQCREAIDKFLKSRRIVGSRVRDDTIFWQVPCLADGAELF